LADNYEGSITSIMTMYQIIHSAWEFNLGNKYRQGGIINRPFLAIYSFLFCFISLALILGASVIGCAFRINCGAPEALNSIGYSAPYAPSQFYSYSGHNVIQVYFRLVNFLVSMVNFALVVFY
jgi:hypothetical protein